MLPVTTRDARRCLIQQLFPDGVPFLWCPLLTHFRAGGGVDEIRLRRHLDVLAPYAKGILVPGSTGEGWEMSDTEARGLLEIVLEAVRPLGLKVLIGVLKRSCDEMLSAITDSEAWLRRMTGKASGLEAMLDANVVGFTVCPPTGRGLTARQISEYLASVLELGHPVALYQLPQVTENEMSPESVADLAGRYSNFYLFKDTSGEDRVARAGLDLHDVFLVRGAEGQYHRWPRTVKGLYDGFLLSSANGFAREQATLIQLLSEGRLHAAEELSLRIENTMNACFDLVRDFAVGNPFTNANKAIDHVLAFGDDAQRQAPPLLYSGHRLPGDFIDRTREILRQQQFLPDRGYMD